MIVPHYRSRNRPNGNEWKPLKQGAQINLSFFCKLFSQEFYPGKTKSHVKTWKQDLIKQMLILKYHNSLRPKCTNTNIYHQQKVVYLNYELLLCLLIKYMANKRKDNLSLLNFSPLWQEDVVIDTGGRLSHHCMNWRKNCSWNQGQFTCPALRPASSNLTTLVRPHSLILQDCEEQGTKHWKHDP